MVKNMRKHVKWISFVIMALILPCQAHADKNITVSASPANVLMGAQFDGLTVKVQGTVPAGSDVVLRFSGAPEEVHFREKGKVFGLLWMNVGKVSLENVPKVYLLDSSRTFDELGVAAAPFRLESLRSTIQLEDDPGLAKMDILHELLLLKKQEGLYKEMAKGVVLGADAGTSRTFSADLSIPSAIAPGHYSVEAIAVRDGLVLGKSSSDIEAKLVGLPNWLSKMAYHNGLLYGVLATLIAIVSGLAIGLVFQSKGGH